MDTYKKLEFQPEVIAVIKNYVYRLIDPRNGETFYIGKGVGNRVFEHMRCAIKDEDSDDLSRKYQTIREIHIAGLEVIHVIHRHGLDETSVRDVKAALIDAYPGTANIIGGYGSSDYGPMNAYEIIQKYSAELVQFRHKVLMITINRSVFNNDPYDATRFAWRIDRKKAEKAELILAVEKGIVVSVFIAEKWNEATRANFSEFNKEVEGRWGFEGKEAPKEVADMYIRKRIPDDYRKKGASNPIKYTY